ncbi:MAG: hypothetical protein RLZZ479_846 [Bacteroidota bacterium]|jgi:hypothetical protein
MTKDFEFCTNKMLNDLVRPVRKQLVYIQLI